eukprot:CAMPEP_0175138260 /NCGR_PEP_ID=MMETSP0087-20121206/10251_1 /TAXON_ID=136419 /ORGANISM="Unknown Unknown, Strain D1" /LENGTH=123 /DNA_ID=CAMNT_0016421145 /DNA_START=39 /DNA_END=407 /DNA_ORIENTATION=-
MGCGTSTPAPAPGNPLGLKVGQVIVCEWQGGQFFEAKVQAFGGQGDPYKVTFIADNIEGIVYQSGVFLPAGKKPIGVNQSVVAAYQDGKIFYAALTEKVDGNKISVKYTQDGVQEVKDKADVW